MSLVLLYHTAKSLLSLYTTARFGVGGLGRFLCVLRKACTIFSPRSGYGFCGCGHRLNFVDS